MAGIILLKISYTLHPKPYSPNPKPNVAMNPGAREFLPAAELLDAWPSYGREARRGAFRIKGRIARGGGFRV